MTVLSFVDQTQCLASEKVHYYPKEEEKKKDGPAPAADKVPYAAMTCDGTYLYVHTVEGLFKIGTGRETLLGKVYLHKNDFRITEKGSLVHLRGKLLFRSAKTRDFPFIIIDTETLEEDLTTEIQYDKDCPNALYVENTAVQIDFSHEMYEDF